MALTPSTMLALGTPAPDFTLPDPHGNTISLENFAGAQALLVIFMCNHCPFVIHLKTELATFASEYQKRGVAVVAINSNDSSEFPKDSPVNMIADIKQYGYTFDYLIDADQRVAKMYQAASTPDFYLFDHDDDLVYRGRFDASRPGNNIKVTGADLISALELLRMGQSPSLIQLPSMGCNIKWRS
jgi:peroxiredoxin